MVYDNPTPPKSRFPNIKRPRRMTRSSIVRRFKVFTPQRNNMKHLRGLIKSQRL